MYRFICLFVLCTAAPAFQSAAGSEDREADVYKIYSLLMTNPQTSHGAENNSRYFIADRTRPPTSNLNQHCVRVPEDRKGEFQEVLADFEMRKASPRLITRRLSISKQYELLTPEDVDNFYHRQQREFRDPRFDGVTDLFTLADVYFSSNGKVALTGISAWCGGTCGLFQWKLLEKLPTGEWKEQLWAGCPAIAKNFRQ